MSGVDSTNSRLYRLDVTIGNPPQHFVATSFLLGNSAGEGKTASKTAEETFVLSFESIRKVESNSKVDVLCRCPATQNPIESLGIPQRVV